MIWDTLEVMLILIRVNLDGKYGFVNKAGAQLIPYNYDEAGTFCDGVSRVKLNGKYGFIDESGTLVIPCKYG